MLVVGVLAAPVLDRFLTLGGPAAAVWVAVGVAATTALAALQGIAQGRQDFHRLAAILIVYAAARVAGGIAGLLVLDGVTGALAGVAAGVLAATAVAWLLVGRPRPARGGWRVIELLVAGQALAGLYLLTNLDPVLARHYLPRGRGWALRRGRGAGQGRVLPAAGGGAGAAAAAGRLAPAGARALDRGGRAGRARRADDRR